MLRRAFFSALGFLPFLGSRRPSSHCSGPIPPVQPGDRTTAAQQNCLIDQVNRNSAAIEELNQRLSLPR